MYRLTSFFCFLPYSSNDDSFCVPPSRTYRISNLTLEYEMSPRGTAELCLVTSVTWASGEALVGCPGSAPRQPRVPLGPFTGRNRLKAEQRELVRPPPVRPGTDSNNHPFCNKQETSLPASKIEQTKTPKYEALTTGQLRFLTWLPDSLQSMCVCFCFEFHMRKCLAMSL